MTDKLLSQCNDEEIFRAFCERVKTLDNRTRVNVTPRADGVEIYFCSIWGPESAEIQCRFSGGGNLESVRTD